MMAARTVSEMHGQDCGSRPLVGGMVNVDVAGYTELRRSDKASESSDRLLRSDIWW